VIVDASVWVSRLAIGEINHAVSQRWIAAQIRSGAQLIVPALALAEVSGALARRTGLPQIALAAIDWMVKIANVQVVSLDHDLGLAAARIAAEHRLRGADATYVAVASALGLPLITWDEQQLTRAASLVPTFRPTA
jgi:predicted nucleic acid-binding protein